MTTDMVTNPTVKAAIEALQKGDRKSWSALFEPNAEFYDDGNPPSFKEFTRDALGHERFTSIDRIENNGLDLTGAFHSDQWGDFRTYFRFRVSGAGKINRLDIGQAAQQEIFSFVLEDGYSPEDFRNAYAENNLWGPSFFMQPLGNSKKSPRHFRSSVLLLTRWCSRRSPRGSRG